MGGFAVGNCEGWLRWGAAVDDVGPPSVFRYEGYVNGIFDGSWFGTTTALIYATQHGTNTFTIKAYDSSRNSSRGSVDIHEMWLTDGRTPIRAWQRLDSRVIGNMHR